MAWPVVAAVGASLVGSMMANKGSKTSQQQMDTLTPEQQNTLAKIMNLIQGQIGKGVSPYPGTAVPGTNPNLQSLYGFPQSPTVSNLINTVSSGKPLFGEDPKAVEEYWTRSFFDPMMSKFKGEVLPQIRENFSGMGAYNSSGRNWAETKAAKDMMTDLSGQYGSLLWGEREAGRGEQVNALQRAMSGIPTFANLYSGAGTMEREQAREPLQEGYQKWAYQQPYNNPWLSQYMNPLLSKQAFTPYLQQQMTPMGMFGNALASAGGYGMGSYMGSLFR